VSEEPHGCAGELIIKGYLTWKSWGRYPLPVTQINHRFY